MWLRGLNDPQRRALLGLAHNVVVSDGLLDPNEEQVMDELRAEMGLGSDVLADYIELDGLDRVFDSSRARSIALINLIRVGYADGAFEIEEECLLHELATQFAVDKPTFSRMEDWVRRYIAIEQEIQDFIA